jgi:hypothetical protein
MQKKARTKYMAAYLLILIYRPSRLVWQLCGTVPRFTYTGYLMARLLKPGPPEPNLCWGTQELNACLCYFLLQYSSILPKGLVRIVKRAALLACLGLFRISPRSILSLLPLVLPRRCPPRLKPLEPLRYLDLFQQLRV